MKIDSESLTWVSVNSIETIKRSIIFPKHTVRSQNDVRTDFIDGGAWNKLKILIYFTFSCMQNTVWISVWCFSIVNYTSVFMSLDFFAQKP